MYNQTFVSDERRIAQVSRDSTEEYPDQVDFVLFRGASRHTRLPGLSEGFAVVFFVSNDPLGTTFPRAACSLFYLDLDSKHRGDLPRVSASNVSRQRRRNTTGGL